MSVQRLELKEEHVKLLKHLRWSLKDGIVSGVGNDGEGSIPPFGEDNIYEAIDLILNGSTEEIDLDSTEPKEYSAEQKGNWDNLYAELPLALDIILYTGKIELGSYKTKYHLRDWKKVADGK